MMSVGIFWFIASGGRTHMIADRTPLSDAEPYGDFLTHPASHYDFWTALQQMSLAELQRRFGVAAPRHHEYEDWPRGRIVHHQPTGRFNIYADRQLHRPAYIIKITARFGLDSNTCDVRADPHYSRARRLPQPAQRDP